MRFQSAEDRLNPVPPEDADETTLGGYQAIHGRAAAFEAAGGDPYTVGVETEETGDPDAPWVGYLVFVRWARTGSAIMGHLETDDLSSGPDEDAARDAVLALPLARVREILDEEIRRRASGGPDAESPPGPDPDAAG